MGFPVSRCPAHRRINFTRTNVSTLVRLTRMTSAICCSRCESRRRPALGVPRGRADNDDVCGASRYAECAERRAVERFCRSKLGGVDHDRNTATETQMTDKIGATRYRWFTRMGMFTIELRRSGLWRVLFGRREVRVSRSADSALGGLLHDETAFRGGPRNSSLGLPTDLVDWARSDKNPK